MPKDRDGSVPPLTRPRTEADQMLADQIRKGEELANAVGAIRRQGDWETVRSEYSSWRSYNSTMLKMLCDGDYLYEQYRIRSASISMGQPTVAELVEDLKRDLSRDLQRLSAIRGQLGLMDAPQAAVVTAAVTSEQLPETQQSPRVFIIHGHDLQAALELRDMLRDKFPALDPLVLSEQPWAGRTVIEKFEQEASDCGFAFAVFTPDDFVQNDGEGYAQMRPNVLFELGWFYGYLGRARTCILYRQGTMIPSDLQGLGWCKFVDSVRQAYLDIEKELRAAYGDDTV